VTLDEQLSDQLSDQFLRFCDQLKQSPWWRYDKAVRRIIVACAVVGFLAGLAKARWGLPLMMASITLSAMMVGLFTFDLVRLLLWGRRLRKAGLL
jgi:polyferredoxin